MQRVVLVTGGTSGLGRATALAFARENVCVAITGRDRKRGEDVVAEIQKLGRDALFIAADLADRSAARTVVDTVVERFGRLDCAFNNAADVGEPRALADYSESEFDQAVSVNLKSVWEFMKCEIRQMLAQTPAGGAIVNTSSVNGLGGVPHGSLYAMAKAGVIALTKSAALEYAKQGIRINALVAGAFHTPMLSGVLDRASAGDAGRRAEIEKVYNNLVAIGRIGDPEEAARAVVSLCSEAASYVIGHSLIVDGGLSAPYR